jgi:hypothetical protein
VTEFKFPEPAGTRDVADLYLRQVETLQQAWADTLARGGPAGPTISDALEKCVQGLSGSPILTTKLSRRIALRKRQFDRRDQRPER